MAGKQLSAPELAYIAGLIDGEGTLSLTARKEKHRRSHTFASNCSIANTNRVMLDRVIELTGVGTICVGDAAKGRRPCYKWRISSNNIRWLLPQLAPYLVIKQVQARLLLRYLSIIEGTRGASEADLPEVLQIHQTLAELNSRGDKPVSPLNFGIRPAAVRDPRVCSEDDCERKCYRSATYCYPHWLARKEPVKKQCERCGVEMEVILSHKRFCSKACQAASRWRAVGSPLALAEKQKRNHRRCKACLEPFDGKTALQEYCSKPCYLRLRRAQQYARAHGLPVPETLQAASHWRERTYQHTCVVCAGEFTSQSPRSAYCGPKCQNALGNAARAQRTLEREAAERAPVPCPECGDPVDRVIYKGRKYCAPRCQARAARKRNAPSLPPDRPAHPRTCVVCAAAFEAADSRKLHCSHACRKVWRARLVSLRESRKRPAA